MDAAFLADLGEFTKLTLQLDRRHQIYKLEYYRPYPYQIEFHNARGKDTGRPAAQRGLMAANGVGKTVCGAAEVAMHATGRYPEWFKGTRFLYPVEILVGSNTNETCRDICQRHLFGDPTDDKQLGTGMVPIDCIGKRRNKTGVPNAFDTVRVKHVSGGWSRIYLRAYEQGWKKFQGIRFDVCWSDEEPPADIWSQLIRATLSRRQSIIFATFTPEEGMTEVVTQLMESPATGQALIGATWDDVKRDGADAKAPPAHLTEDEKIQKLGALRPHERDMRSKGIPLAGSGLIFPVSDEDLLVDPIEIPRHWPQIIGVDFGISTDHPFSAANWAWDRDSDIKYLTHEYQTTNDLPAVHIDAIQAWGKWKPVSWPHDGLNREKGSGDELQAIYRKKGLNLLPWKATNPPTVGQKEGEGGNSVEAAVLAMLDDMYQGRLKVFRNCTTFMKEKRMYHRDLKGKIVRLREDLICAARYGHMMMRHSRTMSVLPQNRGANAALGLRMW